MSKKDTTTAVVILSVVLIAGVFITRGITPIYSTQIPPSPPPTQGQEEIDIGEGEKQEEIDIGEGEVQTPFPPPTPEDIPPVLQPEVHEGGIFPLPPKAEVHEGGIFPLPPKAEVHEGEIGFPPNQADIETNQTANEGPNQADIETNQAVPPTPSIR